MIEQPPSFSIIFDENRRYCLKYKDLFPHSKLFYDPCISPFEPLSYFNPNQTLNEGYICIVVHRYPKDPKLKDSKHYDMDLYVLCPFCEPFEPFQKPGEAIKSTKMVVDQGQIVELDIIEPIFYNYLNYDYEAHIYNEHGINIHTKFLPVAESDDTPNITESLRSLKVTNEKRDTARDSLFRQLGLAYIPRMNFSDRILHRKRGVIRKEPKRSSLKLLSPYQEKLLSQQLKGLSVCDDEVEGIHDT